MNSCLVAQREPGGTWASRWEPLDDLSNFQVDAKPDDLMFPIVFEDDLEQVAASLERAAEAMRLKE